MPSDQKRPATAGGLMLVTHSLAGGGTDRVALYLANGFQKSVSTSLFKVQKSDPVFGLDSQLAETVELVDCRRRKGNRVLNMVAGLPALIRQVHRLRPDIMLATGNNNSMFTTVGHIFNPNKDKRLYVKITNPIIRPHDGWHKRTLRSFIYSRIFSRCSAILALSQAEADILASQFPKFADRTRLVNNPYVTKEMLLLQSVRDNVGSKTVKHFVAIGRLHTQKNYSLLLDAWARARLAGANLQFVGEGPQREMLLEKVKRLGIGDSVEFVGYQRDIAPYLAAAHCLVLSSTYEGLPAVVLEAFSAGCPVMTTDCFPSARELVGKATNCQLVPKDDVEAMAIALRAMAQGPAFDRSLAERALPYLIDESIKSHLSAMSLSV